MLSRSAVVKLKAILIIDLMIVGAAAGVYLYLQEQGAIVNGAKQATFTITDLTVTPPEAYVGEAIQISVNLTNIGDLEGNKTVNLEINNAVKDTTNVTLSGNSSETIQFTDIELVEGNFTVKIGDLTGAFLIKPAPPESSKIVLSNFLSDPYEIWANDNITFSAEAVNPSAQTDKLTVKATIDDTVVATQVISLDAGAKQTVKITVNASDIVEGKHTAKLNTLSGSFMVVKTGYHTLIINRSGGGSKSLPFTLNGQDYQTAFQALLPIGDYSITVPNPFNVGTGVLEFSYWSDGNTNPTRTFTLNSRMILVVTYTLISGYASCPSLYVWNGTGYSYVTDVSNPGWLGYISHINADGQIVFGGGNPWDYIKLNSNLVATNSNSDFDVTLAQQWDELFYLDSASMLVVDHPAGTDVYSTITNYLNKGQTGQVYTVSNNTLLSPISATNENGQNVLADILYQDGIYTPGINGDQSASWDNLTQNQLTLDLGNLSSAQAIKLVITGMVDWGSADPYYAWIKDFQTAAQQGLVPNGTEITPAPYMEVMAANGTWTRVAANNLPIPSDYNARTFAMDLTGLFPAGTTDYKVRFTNFWNVTYDYIGIDTTPNNQTINIQELKPTTATLSQLWDTNSTASGAFTRYGDVTPLVQSADDMFVVGRQGDQVNMLFSTANLSAPAPGMVRDYIFVVACWFKDAPGAWGYGFNFTVDPMPFQAMSGYPYPANETYPYDAAHLAYIQEYNTRIIS